jgi:hypothetical protein
MTMPATNTEHNNTTEGGLFVAFERSEKYEGIFVTLSFFLAGRSAHVVGRHWTTTPHEEQCHLTGRGVQPPACLAPA